MNNQIEDVIVTLTTVPNRLMDIRDNFGTKLGLKTILDQSYLNYKIHFNIPYKYKLTNEEIIIPDWLIDYQKQYNNLEIYRTEDYGPITKILPTINRITNPNAIIIVVDDDIYYMNGMIESHMEARYKYSNYAIGFAGLSALDSSCHFCTSMNKDTTVKILEGYKSVSYRRDFFDSSINNFINKSWNDDIVLSAYMGYKNISKIVISYKNETNFAPRVESFPVLGHTPIEQGGCFNFRNSKEYTDISDEITNYWYKCGYLER
jgi:hypothetical protein